MTSENTRAAAAKHTTISTMQARQLALSTLYFILFGFSSVTSALPHAASSNHICANDNDNGLCFVPSGASDSGQRPRNTCSNPPIDFPGLNLPALKAATLVPAGPVDIINCDAASSGMAVWLTQVRDYAAQASRDAFFGIRSRHGFKALFKANRNIEAVRNVYEKIAAGAIPFSEADGGCVKGQRPAVFCINKPGGHLEHAVPGALIETCGSGRIKAFVSTDAPNIVMVCPAMMSMPDISDQRLQCPRQEGGKLVPNNEALGYSPQAVLTEEFAHMYLGMDEDHAEKYQVQDAVDLGEAESMNNGPSWALFLGCKYCPWSNQAGSCVD